MHEGCDIPFPHRWLCLTSCSYATKWCTVPTSHHNIATSLRCVRCIQPRDVHVHTFLTHPIVLNISWIMFNVSLFAHTHIPARSLTYAHRHTHPHPHPHPYPRTGPCPPTHPNTPARSHARTRVRTTAHTHTRTHAHTHTRTHAHTHTHEHTRTHTHTRTRTHAHARARTHARTHAHAHTHTHERT